MKDSDTRESEMSTLAREFCAFMVRASGLQSKLEAFMEEKCLDFKGGSLLEEQKLEWTLLHKEYLELAEREMEEFLQDKNTKAENVAEALREALGNSLWSLPLLQSLEYESFAAQMITRASAPQLQSEALASGGIFGGIWKLEQSAPRNLERFLKAQGVPWILRRLHVFAEIREVCVVEIPGTVPIFTILQLRDHGFGVSEEQVVADGVERCDGKFSNKAWLSDGELHVLTKPSDGLGNVLQTCYRIANGGRSLLIRRSALERTLLHTLIADDASWSITQHFQRCESTQLQGNFKASAVNQNCSAAVPVQGPYQEPMAATAATVAPRVPTPPLMPCMQAGQDSKKDRAIGLLNEVRAAVMEEAGSRIDARLKQLWTQAVTEVKKQQREQERSMNQLLEEAKILTAKQQSMQAENQALMSMLSSLIKQVMPGEGDCKELSVQGGETPSTATACGSSDGSPSQLANLELDMPELPPFPGAVPVPAVTSAPPGLGPPWPPALPALSLAEALGISEVNKGSEGKAGEAVDAGEAGDASDVDAFVFKLTLRVADDMDLGLCFGKKGEALRIDRVQSGAAESWNRQCSTSGSPERVLNPGDLVVSVNDQSDPEIMLQECTTRKLLKLRVLPCATRAISIDFSYWIGLWTPWRLDDISLGLEAVGLSDTIGYSAKSMDDDYDPFSEEPAPHVAMEKVFRKAARKAAGPGLDAVEWRPQEDPLLGVVKLPPWRRKAAPKANLAPSQPKRKAAPRPRNAQAWLRRPRHNQGGLAEEYFQKEEKQPEKKQKVEAKRGFVGELLEKAPSTLQTCRSLLLFLDKKAEAAPEKPPVRGPEALQTRLEAHAESLGRLEGLRTPGGWDARAKRVLDINATAASPPGEAALSALEKALEKESKELRKGMKEAGEKLEDVLKERQAWAKETVRREWIAWCAKLLRVRENQLLGEKDEAPEQMLMTAMDVLEALVAGTTT
eukprot:s2162_g10.t1